MEKNGHDLKKRTIHSSPTLQEYEIKSDPPVQERKKSFRAGKVVLVIVLLLAVVAAYNLFKNPMYPVYPGPSGQTETSSADIGQTDTSSATTPAETDESEEIVSDSASFSNDSTESTADTEAQEQAGSEDTETPSGSDESADSSSERKTKEDEYTAAQIEEAATHIWEYGMTDEDGNKCYVGFYENEDSSIAGIQFFKTDGSATTFDYHDGEVILKDGTINVTNPGMDELEAGGEYHAYTYTWIRDKESFTKADLGEDEIIVEVDGTQYLLTSGNLETYVTIHQKLVNINWA